MVLIRFPLRSIACLVSMRRFRLPPSAIIDSNSAIRTRSLSIALTSSCTTVANLAGWTDGRNLRVSHSLIADKESEKVAIV
jgi:hypothetical protein